MKIRRRLAVSSGARPSNGPEMNNRSMPGRPYAPANGVGFESVNATVTSRCPASIGTRTWSPLSAFSRYSCSRMPSTSSSAIGMRMPGSGPGNSPPTCQRSISA